MRGVLGLGLTIGLLAAVWTFASGASILFAIFAYSLAGTAASLIAGLVVVAAGDRPEPKILAEQ